MGSTLVHTLPRLAALAALLIAACRSEGADGPGASGAASTAGAAPSAIPPMAVSTPSTPAQASAASSIPSVANPSPSVAPLRRIAFDGGMVTVASEGSMDHVTVRSVDGGVSSESWCARPTSYDAARSLFTEIRAAVLAGDREGVAERLAFPLRVNGPSPKVVHNRKEFLAEYERILTRAVVSKVERAEPRAVFCRATSTMLGDGVFWADVVASELRVNAINP